MIFTGGLTREQAQIQRRALLREIAAEHRKKEHEKLVKLREQLRREVLRYRVERRRTVRQCRAERKQAKKNAKALRQETHDRLKATARESVVAAREACRKEKEAARALVRRESLPASPGPNPYEAKKAARIARMRTRAKRLLHGAEVARQSVRSIGDMIPFGQPILVGHHSERRHRRDLERIRSKLDQSLELGKKAKELERRAERAEKSTAISSDDPDAIAKLRAKLTALERDRARMVAANKAVRSAHPREALAELGFSERLIERILMPDPMGHVGFPGYALANAAHEASRIKKRIDDLERTEARPLRAPVTIGAARVEESENRVRIFFDAKPPGEVRSLLKRSGFRWSPSVGAWQRHASPAAWHSAETILRGRP